jgi:hypothetical protein
MSIADKANWDYSINNNFLELKTSMRSFDKKNVVLI